MLNWSSFFHVSSQTSPHTSSNTYKAQNQSCSADCFEILDSEITKSTKFQLKLKEAL